MAVTSTIEYCTDRDLQDIYPHIAEYDLKRRIYNWETTGTSNRYRSRNSGLVTILFANGRDLGDGQSSEGAVDDNNEWYLDSAGDTIYYFNDATSPNDMVMEAGDDWVTIKTRFRRKASRLIESFLDNRLSREIVKDREGNFPEIIVHITALQAVILLLTAHDPTSELIEPFKAELDEHVDGLRKGYIILPTSISGDASKGVIREVSVDTASDLRPVELRGHYGGTGYELIKIIVDSADDTIIGTATYSVYAKNSTTLKTDQVVKSKTINGDFQSCGVGSLYIRWGTDDTATGLVKEDDEYEIELWGSSLDSSVSSIGSVVMTRR